MGLMDALEREFHSKQEGFISTELMFLERENSWVMVQHWQSKEQSKAASLLMFQEDCTQVFRDALDKTQIKLKLYEYVGEWK